MTIRCLTLKRLIQLRSHVFLCVQTRIHGSFEALGSEIFKEDWVKFENEEPDDGDYYIAVDLAGFADVANATKSKSKRLDQTAIALLKQTQKDGG
jgi:hypothetical protein